MEIIQCSNLLNSWAKANIYGDEDAEHVVLADDMSNYNDFGFEVSQAGEKLYSNIGNLIANVRNTVFLDSKYISNAPRINKSVAEYAGLTEVVKVTANEFHDSMVFDIIDGTRGDITGWSKNTNSFDKLFGKETQGATAKYFNKILPYSQKITVGKNQFMTALGDANKMVSLLNSWENIMKIRRDMAVDTLNTVAFNSAVLTVAKSRPAKSVIALDGNTTADHALQLKEILRNFKTFSADYADDFASSYNIDDLMIVMVGDFYDTLTVSQSDVYHPDMLGIPFEKIQDLNYLQFKDNPDSISGIIESTVSGKYDSIDNIKYIICDKRLANTIFSNETVESQYVPNERVTNIFHLAEQQMLLLPELPCVIVTENGASDVTSHDIDWE